jgi:hypothetical protein
MRMAGDVDYFLRVLEFGALAVLDRVGCRITVHVEQEGTRLSLAPSVMQEQFSLVDSFQRALSDDRSRRDVRQSFAGLSLWQALRSLLAGDVRSAVAHLGVARRNGVGIFAIIVGFARLLLRRTRWRMRGPFVPGEVRPDALL